MEAERIRAEFRRRALEVPSDTYALTKPANLFAAQERTRLALTVLEREDFFPLRGRRILEVGCGSGGWLPTFEGWGAERGDLAGVDLDEARVGRARQRLSSLRDEEGVLLAPGADIRQGDASSLPWADASFDLVVQSTVFSSVLDPTMKRALADEMLRVLRPSGLLFWYDFFFDNPWNPNVRGVGRQEVRSLFPACTIRLRRATLVLRWPVGSSPAPGSGRRFSSGFDV
jgi:ubiquinone/menaquinone biosynthesis C-methylase UbiE